MGKSPTLGFGIDDILRATSPDFGATSDKPSYTQA